MAMSLNVNVWLWPVDNIITTFRKDRSSFIFLLVPGMEQMFYNTRPMWLWLFLVHIWKIVKKKNGFCPLGNQHSIVNVRENLPTFPLHINYAIFHYVVILNGKPFRIRKLPFHGRRNVDPNPPYCNFKQH